MKLNSMEEIKNGDVVRNDAGEELYLYRYNGVLGMIFDEDGMPNIKPLETDGVGHGFMFLKNFFVAKKLEEKWNELWEEYQGHVLDENPDDEFCKMVDEILSR